ncbi:MULTISPECIES: RIP metalloprotease RseP [Pseudanabaena]|jgi:membrane-associated protease RseP (regulator of RpoE activity)|uniref:RIP metalloprotease RseP n=1 Tax=Pseudanabaena TaxID=1152 RepID=UPI00247A0776|nr:MULTISPECIES: RIP metalloprotease RseP [Pseudanabaena]MEA5486351.1 RIP metalloprotease RseP [Pseudanabaena sp. CCNP1317]WGS71500.1 RIP metalloprotease RseP [Pseudanabaena galeata CCNP1313]
MSALPAIAVLAILILVHELGHFMAARVQGIHVNRFSIGFGPVLWKYQGKQTEYALRAIPLGGYVGFPDDDEESNIPADDPNLMKNRPIMDRAIVISAGVIANFVFAYLVLLVMTLSVGIGTVDQPGVRITKILDLNAPAAVSGLQAGDIVLSANGTKFDTSLTTLDRFQSLISKNANQSVDLQVMRDGKLLLVPILPDGESGKGRIGVRLDFTGKPHRRSVHSIGEAFDNATQSFERLVVMTVQGLKQLATNFQNTASQLSGPVAIVAMGSELVKSDAAALFDFTAIISINLAIINILPLPALDGGQLVFLLIEALRGGKPLPEELQNNVMQGGLVILLGLGVVMIFKDSFNLLQQSGLSPL